MDDVAGGGYMDLMTAEQAGHFLQSQANHQSSSLANGDLPHSHHTQATHNGHQVAAGLAQVTTSSSDSMLLTHTLEALSALIYGYSMLASCDGGRFPDCNELDPCRSLQSCLQSNLS